MRSATSTRLSSLSVRVLLAYVAGAALSTALIVLVAGAILALRGDTVAEADVAGRAEDLARMLRFDEAGVPIGFDDSEGDLSSWLYDSMKRETAYRVLNASGQAVLSSPAGATFWPVDRPLRREHFEFEHEGVAMRGATAPVERGGRTWFLQYAISVRFRDLMYRFALPFTGTSITLFSVVLLFVFGACAHASLRYALKPLQALSSAAAAIAPQSLQARLPSDAVPAEIAPLVDSFNRVLARLEHGYRAQQDFLATAAHELKTPLALIRAQVELAGDGVDQRALLGDVEHMTRQVQQLLLLAEASERARYSFGAVNLRGAALQAVDYLQRMAAAAGVRLVAPADGIESTWLADRGALFTLLKNMLENAIQHAPPGTDVCVEISPSELAVRDWGPGVPHEQLPKLFTRFWRGAHRRDHGAGLGLAICQEIARAHGWTLTASLAEPGLRVSVTLAPDAASRA